MNHFREAARLWATELAEQFRARSESSAMDVLDAAPMVMRVELLRELVKHTEFASAEATLDGGARIVADSTTGGASSVAVYPSPDSATAVDPTPGEAWKHALLRAPREGPGDTYETARAWLARLAEEVRVAVAQAEHVRLPSSATATIIEARREAHSKPPELLTVLSEGVEEWTVYSQNGAQLVFPFDTAHAGSGTGIREHFDGNTMRAYIATWAMHNRSPLPNGWWIWDPRWFVLEVWGKEPSYTTVKGKRYPRVNSKDEKSLRDGLEKLLKTRITGITSDSGSLVLKTPEPLIQEVTSPGRSGAVYYHSQLVRDSARRNFFQVPRAVCALHADDVPLGVGAARWWHLRFRDDIVRGEGVSRVKLRELLEEVGDRPTDRARRDGRAYWHRAVERLARVMLEGELGELHVTGEGPDASCVLTPSPSLAGAYQRLPRHAPQGLPPPKEDAGATEHRVRRGRGRPRKPLLPGG